MHPLCCKLCVQTLAEVAASPPYSRHAARVQIVVYHVGTNKAVSALNWMLPKALGGAYHAAVAIYGAEFSYGWNDETEDNTEDGPPLTVRPTGRPTVSS